MGGGWSDLTPSMSDRPFLDPVSGMGRVKHPDGTVCCTGSGCGDCPRCYKDCEWCILPIGVDGLQVAIMTTLRRPDWPDALEPAKRRALATCDGCTRPVREAAKAYRCTTCPNYDLCAGCLARGGHDPTHQWSEY